MKAGYPEALFWESTPRQADLAFRAYESRRVQEHNDRAWLAWHIAALTRMRKRMPKLDKLLARDRTKKPQTWQEQRDIVRMINAMFGGRDLSKKKVH